MIGRDDEQQRIEAFLDAAGDGARALVLHGEAGIGKTTIWSAALEAARTRGFRVLVTRPTQAEAQLPFAALHDLLGEIVEVGEAALPAPQRASLDVALMRATPASEPMAPLALSLAVLALLRAVSADQPIAIAIDDVQWLDESTAGVLRFALRRLERDRVAVVATLRGSSAAEVPPLADVAPHRIVDLPVRALAPAAIEALLDAELGLELAPGALRRVHRLSGGNPFHAVELGRALQSRGDSAADATPLPASLTVLVAERLAALPEGARDVATHAAALSRPTASILARAVGPEAAAAGLEAARAAAVLAPDDDPIRFTHPLLAAELVAALDDGGRRAVHLRLADAVSDPSERARHLALAATGPDLAVAIALDEAAGLAAMRGAPDAAADLSVLAAAQTPVDDPARARRLAAAGRYRLLAGDAGRARELLEGALDEEAAADGAPRAELLYRLAGVRQLMDDFDASDCLGREALRHAGDDPELVVRIKLLLAGVAYITGAHWDEGGRRVAEALRLAEEWEDRRLLAAAIGPNLTWRYAMGNGIDADLVRRAEELEPMARQLRALDRPSFDLAVVEQAEGHIASARARLLRLLDEAERDGDYSSLPFLLSMVALGDLGEGNTDAARERTDRAARLARTTGQRTAQVHTRAHEARLAARLGDMERAASAAAAAFDLMAATKWRVGEWSLRTDLAVLELSRGDAAAALQHVAGALVTGGNDDSGRRLGSVPVAVEALVALGRLEEAADALAGLDAKVAAGRFRRLDADAQRARARLDAARGDLDAAALAIADAEDVHRAMGDRWELARTLLVAGEIHRRSRRRARAREALEEAADLFATLGAARWAEMARDQLGRIGAAREDAGLTPTQREVSELVASGLTNREVGTRLFMSPHTVEAHLSAVYRSLGIRSRRELAAALARQGASVRDSAPPIRDSVESLASGI